MNEKENKLKTIFKAAVREVLKEELGLIIKEVMSGTVQHLTESRIPTSNIVTKPPTSARKPTPASKRVFLEEPIIQDDEIILDPIKENAAKKLSNGKFDVKSLSEFVNVGPEDDPDFANITDDDVDNFINKAMNR